MLMSDFDLLALLSQQQVGSLATAQQLLSAAKLDSEEESKPDSEEEE